MVKNRKLSRAISDLGWREFRTMLHNKADKYGRDFHVIDRWEPTTQTCSNCGEKGGKKDLSIREWTCLWCGAGHDRDINAATNIKQRCDPAEVSSAKERAPRHAAGGHSEAQNERGGKGQTVAKIAPSNEARTVPRYKQLSLF